MFHPSAADARRVIQRTDLHTLVDELTRSKVRSAPVLCPLPTHPKGILEATFQVHREMAGDLWNCPYCGTGTAVDLLVRLRGIGYGDAIRSLLHRNRSVGMKPALVRPTTSGRRAGRHARRKGKRE